MSYYEDGKDHRIVVASLLGDERDVRQAASTFHLKAPKNFCAHIASGPTLHDIAFRAKRLLRDTHQYHSRSVRLGFNSWHSMFISSRPGLMLSNDDETLWNELSGPNYTTPLLRSWVPYIKNKLIELGKLRPLPAIGCTPQILEITSPELDKIVMSGVKHSKLEIMCTIQNAV